MASSKQGDPIGSPAGGPPLESGWEQIPFEQMCEAQTLLSEQPAPSGSKASLNSLFASSKTAGGSEQTGALRLPSQNQLAQSEGVAQALPFGLPAPPSSFTFGEQAPPAQLFDSH